MAFVHVNYMYNGNAKLAFTSVSEIVLLPKMGIPKKEIGDLKAVLLTSFQCRLNYEIIEYPPSAHDLQHQSPWPCDFRSEQKNDFPK